MNEFGYFDVGICGIFIGLKKNDIANGEGVRVSLFVSGCRNHCNGCHNPEAWNFSYGKPFTKETENEIIGSLRPSWIQGLSVLGGEPCEEENEAVLIPFLKRVRTELPDKNIWLYFGYTYKMLQGDEILWDENLLVELLEDIQSSDFDLGKTGFYPPEIEQLFNQVHDKQVKEDSFDVEEELQKSTFSKPGNVWNLGRHRIICGDSTKPETYESLMDNQRANLILTDPPYNVDVEETAGKIMNDNMSDSDFYNFLLADLITFFSHFYIIFF